MANGKAMALAQIAADIVKNNVCPDLAQTATQLVMGEGNLDSEIVFIGEAPGKQEDIQGKPFVGASGKFLNEMLESIGMDRASIYITNIVKYRPPNNRDPKPEEKAAFLPYLEKQLEIIQPKLVITLGRHSMEVFMPSLKISQAHGTLKRTKGRIYMPLFHPAAALYNGQLRQTLLDDFARIPEALEVIENELHKSTK